MKARNPKPVLKPKPPNPKHIFIFLLEIPDSSPQTLNPIPGAENRPFIGFRAWGLEFEGLRVLSFRFGGLGPRDLEILLLLKKLIPGTLVAEALWEICR